MFLDFPCSSLKRKEKQIEYCKKKKNGKTVVDIFVLDTCFYGSQHLIQAETFILFQQYPLFIINY